MARAAWVALGCLVAIACSSTREADVHLAPPATDTVPTTAAPEETDLSGLIERTHYAFRDHTFADRAYATTVAPDGAITFTPARARAATLASTVDGVASMARGIRELADGGIEIDRGVAREQLHNTRLGLEQSWLFTNAPPGSNDLVVRVKLEGWGAPLATASGLHFADNDAKRFLRYGHGTWIDATGARTTVESSWEGGSVVLRVPRDVVAASTYPTTLDPTIGPEVAVDAPVTSAAGPAAPPTIASGPNGTFVAVWADNRPGVGSGVMAMRIAADGTPMTPGIILPMSGPGYLTQDPKVAYDSVTSRWLVVSVNDGVVRGARIDATNGAVLDAAPITIAGDINTNRYSTANVGFDGTKWLVAFGGNVVTKIVVVSVDSAGTPGTAFDATTAASAPNAMSCTATTCAILTTASGNLTLLRINKGGGVAEANGISLGAANANPLALTNDGTQYFAVYGAGGSGQPNTLVAKRIDAAGTVLDSTAIALASKLNSYWLAGATWNGSRFVVVSTEQFSAHIFAQRVQPNGTVDDTTAANFTTFTATQALPAIAWSGAQGYVVWLDSRLPFQTIYGGRISTTLAAADGDSGVLVSKASNAQEAPSVAGNANGFLAAWLDLRAGPAALYAVRLTTTGAPTGTPIILSSSPTGDVTTASDGTDFLVMWREGSSLVAKRVSGSTGAALDNANIAITSALPGYGASGASAAFDGQSYVLAWSDGRYNQFQGSDVFAARLSKAGVVLDPYGIQLAGEVAGQYEPAVASDGTTTLVVYTDEAAEGYYGGDLYGVRLDHAGKVLDATPFLVAQAGFRQGSASVTWDGTYFFVAWEDQRRTTRGDSDIYVTRVTSDGKSLDTSGTLVASLTTASSSAPHVVTMGDGVSNLVVWTETAPSSSRARGAFVRAGTYDVLDKPALDLLGQSGVADNGAPTALASAGAGKALLAYQRFVESELAQRALVRFIESGKTPGGACGKSADCQSRYCTDAVCCTEPCDAPCRKCGAGGACAPVLSADDDNCAGSCDAQGACKKKNGDVCSIASECASNFCVDGFCCNTACDGACDVCNEPRGTCTPVPTGTRGTPSCSPKVCNGFDAVCPAKCARDEDCADGFGCDRPTGECVSGAVCSDEHTLRAPNGIKTDCRPYGCRSGACATTCKTVEDCAFPAACDELGRCIQPQETAGFASGCAMSPMERGHDAAGLFALFGVGLGIASRRTRRSGS